MKTIPLTQGKVALVDDEDYNWLMQWKWTFHKGYADRNLYLGGGRKNSKRKTVWMHRVIAERHHGPIPRGNELDHKNQNKLDNQKQNLRIATRSQNQGNTAKQPNNTSGYKGVRWRKDRSKWLAEIRVNYKLRKVGHFTNIIDAAKAYNAAAIKHFGEFAHLNDV